MHKVFNDPLLAMEPPIALVTLRRQDGSEALLRTSAAPLLANLDGEHEANAGPGEGYTVSKPSEHKVPRRFGIVKTDAQMRAEGHEPISDWKVAKYIGLSLAGLLAFLFIVNVGARWSA